MTQHLPTPTLTPSCAIPTERPTLTEAGTTLERIALAGYAAQHAPTPEKGTRIGTMALRMRAFDRAVQ